MIVRLGSESGYVWLRELKFKELDLSYNIFLVGTFFFFLAFKGVYTSKMDLGWVGIISMVRGGYDFKVDIKKDYRGDTIGSISGSLKFLYELGRVSISQEL